jgi:hypothetical protein
MKLPMMGLCDGSFQRGRGRPRLVSPGLIQSLMLLRLLSRCWGVGLGAGFGVQHEAGKSLFSIIPRAGHRPVKRWRCHQGCEVGPRTRRTSKSIDSSEPPPFAEDSRL